MADERAEIEAEGFLWDFEPDGNVAHLAAHDVRPADVYAVLAFEPLYFRSLGSGAATHAMVGRDLRGRSLIVYMLPTPERGIWKPVTAWRSRVAHQILEQEGRI